MRTKICSDCGSSFVPRGRRSHRCLVCQDKYEKYAAELHRESGKFRKELITENSVCQKCGTNRTDLLEVDHIVPISRNGTSERSNLRVLCHFCNMSKGTKDDSESNSDFANSVLKQKGGFQL